jgi:DUF971 family protein
MAPDPRTITRSDPRRIKIEWGDGTLSDFSAAALRSLCPCAACVDELSRVRRLDPSTVPPDLTQFEVRLVGNYALAIRFSDGHATGIYPFKMLWEQGNMLRGGPAGT